MPLVRTPLRRPATGCHSLIPRAARQAGTGGEASGAIGAVGLRQTADAFLDLTFGYPERRAGGAKVRPSVNDLLFGFGRQWHVHVHVRVLPMAEVPEDPDDFTKWLMGVFAEKNELLEHFERHGCFPGERHELPRASCASLVANLACFVAIALVFSAVCLAAVSAVRSSSAWSLGYW